MIGATLDGKPPEKCTDCGSPMRPIEWRDLDPANATPK